MTERKVTFKGPNNNHDDEEANTTAHSNSSDDDSAGFESNRTTSRMNDMTRAGRISTREMNFEVPTQKGVQEHIEESHGHKSWRLKCLRFIHRNDFQIFMMILLLFDVLVLFTELFLLALYPQCNLVERDCIACCPDTSAGEERWLAGGSGGKEEEICESGYSYNIGEPSCDTHKWQSVHNAELAFFGITVTILSLFLLENLVELVALGPRIFFKQIWFVADLFIVSISLVLELVFHFAGETAQETLGGFLVVFRLWRFLRISHGLIEVSTEFTHRKYDELIEYAKDLEKKLQERNVPFPDTTKRVQRLCHPKRASPQEK